MNYEVMSFRILICIQNIIFENRLVGRQVFQSILISVSDPKNLSESGKTWLEKKE